MREARATVREVGPGEAELARASAARGSSTCARRAEWEEGHIAGATHVSRSYLEQQIEGAAPDHDAPIVLYCAGGVRSLFAGPDAAGRWATRT